MVRNPPAVQETPIPSLGREDPLEKGKAVTPVLLPGESHGQWSLTGYSPWGCKESDTTERVTLGQSYRFCSWEGHCRALSGSLQQVPPALSFCIVVRMCQSQAPSVSICPSPGGHQLVFYFLGRGPTLTHSRAPLHAPGGPGLQGPAASPHAIVFRETVGLGAGAGLVPGEGRWVRSLRLHPRGSCRVGVWGSGGVLTPTPVFREWGRPGPDPAALPGEGLGGQPVPPGHRAGE